MRSLLRGRELVSLVGLAAGGVGTLLYVPQGPDAPFSLAAFAGAILLFALYLASQIAWGRSLGRLLGQEPKLWESYLYGTAFFALLLGTMGFFPIVGAPARLGWIAFLLLGCALRLPGRPRRAALGWVDAAAFLAFGLAALGASAPHSFWDSLWYHLPAGRIWFEAGRVHLPALFPIALKTGLWDYHFLLGQILLGGPAGGGLVAAQVFGQWAHLTSLVFCFLLLREEAEAFGLSPFAALLGVLGTELFLVAEFAKNDAAATLFSLACAAFALRRRHPALVGAAAGFAFAAKFSCAFFLLPLLVWNFRRARPREILFSAGAFLLAAAPLLLRNALLTGNPVFPAMNGVFHSPLLGPSWNSIAIYEGTTFAPAALAEKLGFLARDNWILWALLLAPFTVRSRPPALLAALAAALAFLFAAGPKAEWRLIAPALVLLAAYAARALELAFGKHARLLTPLALILFLALRPLDWRAPLHFPPPASLLIREWNGGSSFAWLRMEGAPGALAATLNESRVYYLSPRPILRAFDYPPLDRALAAAPSPGAMVQAMRRERVRYVVLSAEFLDRYYNRAVCDAFYALSEQFPAAVAYREPLARVLDLDRLPPDGQIP